VKHSWVSCLWPVVMAVTKVVPGLEVRSGRAGAAARASPPGSGGCRGVTAGLRPGKRRNAWTQRAGTARVAVPECFTGHGGHINPTAPKMRKLISKATGEMVAINQDTGKILWADQLPSSPYGAATVTNDVVFTTTYSTGGKLPDTVGS